MVLRNHEMLKFLDINLNKSNNDKISGKKHKYPDHEDQSVSKKKKTEEHLNIEPTNERSFKCTFQNCDKSYFKVKLLQRHVRQKHSEEKLLEKKKSVSNYSDVTSESSDINSEKPHKCTYNGCQAAFKKPSRLVWHVRQHTGERPFNCSHKNCEKAYATAAHLKRHEASHENVEPCIVCPSCTNTFKNRHNLKKHYHRTHSEDANRLSCNECGAKFRKKYKLDEHIAMHNGVFHECDKCKKRFSTLYLLNKHVSGSHRKKSYECTNNECTEVFDTWKMMINHRKNSHAKEFQCLKCDRNFNFKMHLKKHLASHKENNLFICPYDKCPKFYTLKRNLNQHINIKHLNIKFVCDYCQVAFSAKNVVRRHIEKIHLSIPVPRKTSKGNRQKRKDAGTQRKSALGKLIGLELPLDVEKQLMERVAEVNFEDKLFDSPSVIPA